LKCLLVADLHYDLRKFDWVVNVAAHVDVVVLAGDHLDAFSVVDRPAQTIVVQKYLRRIRERAPLLICSGNHDLDGYDSRGELITRWITKARHYDVLTDGDSRLIGDTLFTICPWGGGSGTRAEIARHLARDAPTRPARWLWVHHAPRRARRPAGTASDRSATLRCAAGSGSISRMSFWPATCINRHSRPRARGRIGSAGPGSSMPVIRLGRCHRMWWSIWRHPTPTGSR
jgi:hypothetical protein